MDFTRLPRALRLRAPTGATRARRITLGLAMRQSGAAAVMTRSRRTAAAAATEVAATATATATATAAVGSDARRRRMTEKSSGTDADAIADDEDLSELSSALSELSPVPSDLSDTEGQQQQEQLAATKKKLKKATVVPVAGSVTASPYFRPAGAELESAHVHEQADWEGTATTVLGKRRRRRSPVAAQPGLRLGSPIFSAGRGSRLRARAESSKRKRTATVLQIEAEEEEAEEAEEAEEEEGEEEEEEEEEEEIVAEVEELELEESKGKKPARRQKRNTVGRTLGPLPPPPHWEEMYGLVREMRSRTLAPVDTMGCERLALRASGQITPAIYRFQTLVSLLLSSQTKDTVTSVAVRKLQTTLPGGLTISSILSSSPQLIDSLITPVGFHNRKTQYLQQTAQILHDKYNDDIPRSIEELCSLPGVGPKMAHLCMSVAWGETVGIGVDVHVHRITNLWGWTGKKGTDTPEQTRLALESWLPRDLWREINYLLVGFGQTICLPRGAKCGECTLAEKGLCRAARVPPVAKRRKAVRVGTGVKVEDDAEVKKEVKEEDAEQEMILELVPRIEYTGPTGQTEVKLEGQETVGEEVLLKREVKQELDLVYPNVKAQHLSEEEGSSGWVKRGLKEEMGGDVPDMEDILGRAPLAPSSSPVSKPARKRGARRY